MLGMRSVLRVASRCGFLSNVWVDETEALAPWRPPNYFSFQQQRQQLTRNTGTVQAPRTIPRGYVP